MKKFLLIAKGSGNGGFYPIDEGFWWCFTTEGTGILHLEIGSHKSKWTDEVYPNYPTDLPEEFKNDLVTQRYHFQRTFGKLFAEFYEDKESLIFEVDDEVDNVIEQVFERLSKEGHYKQRGSQNN